MKDAGVGWALAKLAGSSGKNKLESAALDELAKRFGFEALGRELLALAWAAEKSLEITELTVARARHALGQSLDAILSAGGILRRHSLIQLEVAGPATAKSEIRLGIGLGARLDGAPL